MMGCINAFFMFLGCLGGIIAAGATATFLAISNFASPTYIIVHPIFGILQEHHVPIFVQILALIASPFIGAIIVGLVTGYFLFFFIIGLIKFIFS
jgi:hypothetical protein